MSESETCVFCGIHSRNKRKRDTCDTYEQYKIKALPKTLKQVVKRHQNVLQENIDGYVKCSKCQSISCLPCIQAICSEIKSCNLHKQNDWYDNMQLIINGGKGGEDVIGHCCELRLELKNTNKKK